MTSNIYSSDRIQLNVFVDDRDNRHMKLSETLTRKMKSKGFTLTKLAEKSGVPKPTLHGWTTGRRALDPDCLRKVAAALEISVHELLFGVPDPYHSASREILEELFQGDVRITIHRIEQR